jgi:hypothetical protein
MSYPLPLLFLAIVLVSCGNNTETDFFTDADRPDTSKPVITTTFHSKAFPEIFDAAFHKETKVKEDDISFSFYPYEVGKINIETGKIIAGDPIYTHDAIPFITQFPMGQFAVTLAMATTNDDERVAFSRILFSTNAVAKWELALQKGEKPLSLKDTITHCYGVDGGMGLFIDSAANNVLNQKSQSEWKDIFITRREVHGNKGYIYEFDGHSLATFTTGWGDGCYSTYIGLDEKGNICQLLTDFGLVGWWKLDEKK